MENTQPEYQGEEFNAKPRYFDPFGEDVALATLIQQMRIYDVLMTILTVQDKDAAARLNELHTRGGTLSPIPSLDLSDRLPQNDA